MIEDGIFIFILPSFTSMNIVKRCPRSDQTGWFLVATKMHKFEYVSDITLA